MSEQLRRVENKETKDILFLVENVNPRYILGEKYVAVKRSEYDRQPHFIKRNSIRIID